MGGPNYFKDLSLPLDATGSDVRDAYKKLAKQWHPDKNKDEGAEEKFKQVLAAYTHLQSDDRRETHAREIKRQQTAAATPKPPPQPPPQPPSQPKPKPEQNKPNKPSEAHNTGHTQDSTPRARSAKSKPANSKPGSNSTQKNWWESFKAKNPSQSKNSSREKSRGGTRQSRPSSFAFMDSFMSFDDPFDDILFSIFMIPPERPAPKQKQKVDPFGNKLPKNVENDIYDWKSATKSAGQMPDYQEFLDGKFI